MVVSSPTPSSAERPERSRNAKAQARHRAKRKAYIQQLETSVAKLQAVAGLPSADHHATPPGGAPSHGRMRELEDENARLRAENDDLRRRLASDDGEISASTSVYGYDDRPGASPRRSNSFYSPTTSAPRGFGDILADPADGGATGASRTSSHSSLASLAAPPSLTHSSGSLPDSPASSHSAGSPLSAASPLVLPGLRLPPHGSGGGNNNNSGLASPHAYGAYGQTSPVIQQEQQARATHANNAFTRSPYAPLPPISTPSSALPTFSDYFSTATGQYVKNEDSYSQSAYQGAYQQQQQQQYASSYGNPMSYGMVPSDMAAAWSTPASRR